MLEKLLKKAEELEWSISCKNDDITFQKYTPESQDFSFEVSNDEKDIESFLDNIKYQYENYDVSYEAYLWLDNNGHGKNGAPYDMKDVYEDMEWCKDSIIELYDELSKLNN